MLPPAVGPRDLALDRLRTFATLIVVAHHSVLAYCRFDPLAGDLWATAPLLDDRRWSGFDVFVLVNDLYFMSLFFFLSGLFVPAGLARRGAAGYLHDRGLRLGVPFIAVVALAMPLAYLPGHLASAPDAVAVDFWKALAIAAWPCGPAWFVAVLFAFDACAAAVHSLGWFRTAAWLRWRSGLVAHPARLVAAGLSLLLVACLPLLLIFEAGEWARLGPFVVQKSRVLLYAAWFGLGAMVGSERSALLSSDGAAARSRVRWVCAAIVLTGLVAGLQVLAGPERGAAWWVRIAGGVAFTGAGGAIILALLGAFARSGGRRVAWLDRLREHAYGIYLIHYLFVVWLQYWLLGWPVPAAVKAAIVFVVATALAWLTTAALRRIPAVARVL